MKASKRFWSQVLINPDACWEWQGGISNGYGSFFLFPKKVKAHRYSYEQLVGEIPIGLEIDHLCRNRSCVNPAHMETVTRSENIRRGLLPNIGRQYQESKTHCPQGHAYDETNTYIRKDRPGRDCKVCRLNATRRWLERARS